MPCRSILAQELSEILKVIAHPDRVRLIEELKTGELDVTAMAELLDVPAARVSQHLALMRAHRLVEETRDGRRHLYHLAQPELADWLLDGVAILEHRASNDVASKKIYEAGRKLWAEAGADKPQIGKAQ
ncbi:MAG: metalloregulator ArsR/SmtB family transcription factor [Parvularculaceae bacterium]